jgi:hypothetical protein
MNFKLYQYYGRKFIETWESNAADDLQLVISYEGDKNDLIEHQSPKIKIIDLSSNEHNEFINKYGRFSEAQGLKFKLSNKFPGVATYDYNYRFDAVRFSFKIFSIKKCFDLGLIKNNFAWLDADVVCLRPFSSSDLDQFFPSDKEIISYLGRNNFPKPNSYSECGFVGFNFYHKEIHNFISNFLKLYTHGDLFHYKEWHDSYLFDVCRKKFEANGYEFKNLSRDYENEEHPFMKTELSIFFDHLKGPVRKQQGHS